MDIIGRADGDRRRVGTAGNLALHGAAQRRRASELSVTAVRDVAGVAELRADFESLHQATGNSLPFALFEWHLAWCRHFLGSDAAVCDQPLYRVARTAAGVCVGIIPLIQTRRRLGTLSVSTLGLLGADPALTEVRASLVRPGYEDQVADALHAHLNTARDWDWIHWMGPVDRFNAALARLRGFAWQPAPPAYVLDLPDGWDTLRAGLKRNIRESLRHCYNSLKRDGHAFNLVVATDPASVRTALERVFELHAMRADLTGTVAHPDRFESPAVRAFVHDACAALAARGSVRIFQMEIAGHIVAARIGFVVGDGLYLYYSGFDPAWARYSVMTTTVAEAIKYAIAKGLRTVNLSPGNDVSKTRWGPREVPHQVAYELSGRWTSRLARRLYLTAKTGSGFRGQLLRRLMPGRRTWS